MLYDVWICDNCGTSVISPVKDYCCALEVDEVVECCNNPDMLCGHANDSDTIRLN